MKKIKITIDKIGRPKIEAEGFMGGACLTATNPIVKAFDSGSNTTIDELPEMYLTEENIETETEGV
jgi:hypothetical protein